MRDDIDTRDGKCIVCGNPPALHPLIGCYIGVPAGVKALYSADAGECDPRRNPDTLRAMLRIIASEVVGYRRQLGDSNCEVDEVLEEAWHDVNEKAKDPTP